MALTYDRQIAEEVKKLVVEKIEDDMEVLSNGNLISHAEYKFYAGEIRGLRFLLTAFEQAKTKLEKGDRRE